MPEKITNAESAALYAKENWEKDLSGIEAKLGEIEKSVGDRISKVQREVMYDRLKQGILLIKAEALHKLPESARWQGDGGWYGWLSAHGMPRKTADLYIKAAEGAGFTIETDPDEVDRLRASGFLDGSSLKKLAGYTAKPEPPSDPAVREMLKDDALKIRALWQLRDSAVAAGSMVEMWTEQEREQAAANALNLLEELTEARWKKAASGEEADADRILIQEDFWEQIKRAANPATPAAA